MNKKQDELEELLGQAWVISTQKQDNWAMNNLRAIGLKMPKPPKHMLDWVKKYIAQDRLEELRTAIQDQHISYGELAELVSLKEYIEPGDVELLEAAGVPEFDQTYEFNVNIGLNLNVFAKSEEEARAQLSEAVREYFNETEIDVNAEEAILLGVTE